MRPLELRIKGLRSWRSEQVIDFRGLGLFAIIGETGAGKSSLLEALVYALYNASTFSGHAGALISGGEQTMSVSLEFEADGERWLVTRSTSVGGYPPPTHRLICLSNENEPSVEKEAPVNRRVQGLIGLDLKGFTSAVLLPQGRFQTLLTSTEGDRSSILKGIFRLDELSRLRERADGMRRSLETPLAQRRQERAALLDNPAAVAKEQAKVAQGAGSTLKALRAIRDEYEEAAREAEQRANESLSAAQLATRLAQQVAELPSLKDARARGGELVAERAGLEREQATYRAARDQARQALDDARSAGETIESLTRACQTLTEAGTTFADLERTRTRLSAEAETIAERERTLKSERAVLAQERERLETEDERITQLDQAATQAEQRHRDGAAALGVVRQRARDAEQATERVGQMAEQLATARSTEQKAKAAEHAAQAELERARVRYDEAQRANSAAAAAVGIGAGDACPVCTRILPAGFEPPLAPDLEHAHTQFHAADEQYKTAARAAASAETQREQLEALAREAEQTKALAEREMTSARTVLEQTALGEVDLGCTDDELLEPLLTAATTARTAASDAATALAGEKAAASAKSGQLQEQEQAVERERTRIARESDEEQQARARLREAIAVLPETFRTDREQQNELDELGRRAEARLTELRAVVEAESEAIKECERIEHALTAVEAEHRRAVDTPRRHAATQALALCALLESLPEPPAVPTPPADNAVLTEHIEWIDEVAATARAEATALEKIGIERKEAARAATERQSALLTAADARDPDARITDEKSLREAVEEWAVRERTATALRDQAQDQIEWSATLDQLIATLEGLRRACDEVARLTTDAKFIRWLVARRQRALLEVSSDRLLEITAGRYGFAEDFQVVDRRTGQPRSPRTLSGGETFQASLALALGMVELAARSGGRIGSFYLDEGFGSLDPNALDEALSALEQRAQTGQMIAVISHVSAVAERLQRVLRVTTGPDGSRIEELDPSTREALVEEELAEATAEVAL